MSQALAFAIGLVVLVFRYLYLAWRSVGDDRTASILWALFAAVSVSLLGTFASAYWIVLHG